MKKITRFLILSMIPLCSLAAAHAQPEAVGDILNLATNDGQDANYAPALSSDLQGNYIVAWGRWTGENGNESEAVFRRFDSGDRPVSARREINQYRLSYQHRVDVAMNDSGWFAATWTSSEQDGSGDGVYARLYNRRKPVTGEILVPVRTEGQQQQPAVAIDTAGRFLVVWEGPGSEPEHDVFARRFDSAGRPLGKPYRINTYTANAQSSADVAMRADGRHVVVWRSWQQAGLGAGIYAQRFDRQGRRLGGEIRVNQDIVPNFGTPTVAMAQDGSFVVAWDRCDFSDILAGCAVLARRFNAAGRPLSAEVRVSLDDTQTHIAPQAAYARNGSFAITWALCDTDPQGALSNCRVATRFHDSDGEPYAEVPVIEWNANLYRIAVTAVGADFLVAWDGENEEIPGGIFGQRYRLHR